MLKKRYSDQKHRQYLGNIRVAATLLDGTRTFEEIALHAYAYLIPLGLFKLTARQVDKQSLSIKKRLEDLIKRGWVVNESDQYALTPLGREEVSLRLSQFSETGKIVSKFLQPQAASKVTLGLHLLLAALKLPAALLSHSVGLLNDAIDTLLDGLSSMFVYFAIRFHKERIVNILLVTLMLVTGFLTLYEAGRRFFIPFKHEVDWFAFLAASLSALFCLGLGIYQRYVGLRSGILALITQSVDSRNHVIVAISVTAGLVASLLHFPLLDTLVGLAVALLILKSAITLTIETIRSLGEEQDNLSRYEFGLAGLYNRFLQSQLRDWMLYLVDKQGIRTQVELTARACQALDFNQIPAVRAMELTQGKSQASIMVEQSLTELVEHGWLTGEKQLSVTEAGKKRLKRLL
jgi:hypothetical protein